MHIPWIPGVLLLSVGSARADPTYELATNPLAAVDEDYSLSFAGVIGPHVVVRGEVQLATSGVPLAQATVAAGASVRLFLDHAFTGPFIEPGIVVRTTSATGNCLVNSVVVDGMCGYTPRTLGPEVSVGWQWIFGSHYTASASLGVEKAWLTDDGISPASIPTVVTGALRVGYAW